jgi:hypothetical protein
MMQNSKISKVPGRILNKCSLFHTKCLRAGILPIEFKQDIRAQDYFSAIVSKLELNRSGHCRECEKLMGSK